MTWTLNSDALEVNTVLISRTFQGFRLLTLWSSCYCKLFCKSPKRHDILTMEDWECLNMYTIWTLRKSQINPSIFRSFSLAKQSTHTQNSQSLLPLRATREHGNKGEEMIARLCTLNAEQMLSKNNKK